MSHYVSLVSLAAKASFGCGVSWRGGLFGFFVSFVAFASLHVLALSLTGAQRTDSSSASKKIVMREFGRVRFQI